MTVVSSSATPLRHPTSRLSTIVIAPIPILLNTRTCHTRRHSITTTRLVPTGSPVMEIPMLYRAFLQNHMQLHILIPFLTNTTILPGQDTAACRPFGPSRTSITALAPLIPTLPFLRKFQVFH